MHCQLRSTGAAAIYQLHQSRRRAPPPDRLCGTVAARLLILCHDRAGTLKPRNSTNMSVVTAGLRSE